MHVAISSIHAFITIAMQQDLGKSVLVEHDKFFMIAPKSHSLQKVTAKKLIAEYNN